MSLGQRIKDARAERGLKQKDLAKAARVSTQAVSQWETGKTRPDLATLNVIANVLSTDYQYLLGEGGHPSRRTSNECPIVQIGDVSFFSRYTVRPLAYEPKNEGFVVPQSIIVGQGFALKINAEMAQGNIVENDIAIFAPNEVPRTNDMVLATELYGNYWPPIFGRLTLARTGGTSIVEHLEAKRPPLHIGKDMQHRAVMILATMVELRRLLR